MKKILLLPLALVAALFVVTVAAGANTATVQITAAGFAPKATNINPGDTVTWHNADTANHQVVANNGSFASPVLKANETWSHTFSASGKVNYRDSQSKATGTVNVAGQAPGVSLNADRSTIVYRSGQTVTLSGTVNSGAANESVTLKALAYGQTAQQAASTTKTTTTNGAFEFSVAPTRQTVYTVEWKNATSSPVTVNVSPRVGFGRSGRLYTAKVTSEIPYTGHLVFVQQHGSFGWKNIKKIVLGSGSRRVFGLRLSHGRHVLRLYLTTQQAGPGYVASASRLLAIRR